MPVAPTYPGVYVQEVPSGVRTITGVATSITAFLGRVVRGPVNEPTTINSLADFNRIFGGMKIGYPLGYAVKDFYLNGGSQAIVVGLYRDAARAAAGSVAKAAAGASGDAAAIAAAARAESDAVAGGSASQAEKDAADAVATVAESAAAKPNPTAADVKEAASDAALNTPYAGLARLTDVAKLPLEAAYPGPWGNKLAVRVDYDGIDADVAERFGLEEKYLFNLTIVEDPPDGPRERILNLSLHPDAGSRRIDRALEDESFMVRFPESELPAAGAAERPAVTPDDEDPTVAGPEMDKIKFFKGGAESDVLDSKTYIGDPADKSGLHALDSADLFNLLCIPPDDRAGDIPTEVYQEAMSYCAGRRAMLIVDPPMAWGAIPEVAAAKAKSGLSKLGLTGPDARNAALYFPRVIQPDPERDGQLDTFVPCGIVAGVMARTDTQRGVWKAPAGIDASLNGTQGLQVSLNDAENGMLNPLGINCLRAFPIVGRVVWGGRTLRGADQLADEYKYVPVRRLALYLEESLYRGLKWVVFEPNDEPLWASIRLNVGAFMHNLFRQGAFQGQTPRDAYFVKCDGETTTQNDRNMGIVNVVVGFAPLKPAEFVILTIQQIAGNVQV
jgi:phage tail sheath protein FI